MNTAPSSAEWLEALRGSLAGKVAVVTGGGRGIGREVARVFARLGAKVVVAELADDGAETERVVRDAGGAALFVRTDVASEASVSALARRMRGTYGAADILVNNAILCPVSSVVDMDVALWDRVVSVNLRGAFLTCRAFLPGMLARKQGVIVNMVSTDAMPYLSAYIATKQGLVGFTQSLAAEVGEAGVRVVAFGPGFVDTPGLREGGKELAPRLGMTLDEFLQVSMHPAYDGMMPPEHAAVAAAYLVVRFAGDYHGDVVDGYTVLERAGLIEPHATAARAKGKGRADRGTAAEPGEGPDSIEGADARQSCLDRAIILTTQLKEIIRATDEEFGRLPLFIRPIARRGFRATAGQGVEEWSSSSSNLVHLLNQVKEESVEARERLCAGYSSLRPLLLKLISYCKAAPGETARFTRDAEFVEVVARTMAERQSQVECLVRALDEVVALGGA